MRKNLGEMERLQAVLRWTAAEFGEMPAAAMRSGVAEPRAFESEDRFPFLLKSRVGENLVDARFRRQRCRKLPVELPLPPISHSGYTFHKLQALKPVFQMGTEAVYVESREWEP